MGRILTQHHQKDGITEITISPALLWVIVIVAIIFFTFGILHLLLRFFSKNQTFPPISQSNRYNEISVPQSLGRQLHQLFRLHDSGLDQSFIDTLPVFYYNNIVGLQDPFDCAVCLCEFSPDDKLRLIPICSHAFHTHCIDTWLLSNSTCPLCRCNLSSSPPMESPSCNHNGQTQNSMNVDSNSVSSEIHGDTKNLEKRVLSVRLGKLKSFNGGERSNGGEIMDSRRCFSMGSVQYVVNDFDLQVALFDVNDESGFGKSGEIVDGRIKGESFSVSKVWLWSKRGKFSVSSSSETKLGGVFSSENIIVPGV